MTDIKFPHQVQCSLFVILSTYFLRQQHFLEEKITYFLLPYIPALDQIAAWLKLQYHYVQGEVVLLN